METKVAWFRYLGKMLEKKNPATTNLQEEKTKPSKPKK